MNLQTKNNGDKLDASEWNELVEAVTDLQKSSEEGGGQYD